jgi:uncharacterized protein (TIGR02099 family)
MTPFRRRLRKLRFFLQALFVTLVISAAAIVAFAQLALPWLADNPQRIEGWLSERLGRQVSIGSVSGMWTRAGPRLVINDLRIAATSSTEGELRLPRSELALNLYAAFQHNRSWNEFRVVGLDLALSRDANGDWKLRGLDLSNSSGQGTSMGALGVIVLVDMNLAVTDPTHGIDLGLRIPELRGVNLGRITRVLGRLGSGTGTDTPLSLAADIDVKDHSGRLYVGGRDLDMAHLLSGHPVDGVELVSATGDLEVWGSWKNGRVEDARVRLAAEQLIFQARDQVAVSKRVAVDPRTAFDSLSLSARLQQNENGRRFDLAEFRATRQGVSSQTGRLVAESSGSDATNWQVNANGLDVDAVAQIGMLAKSTPPRLRRWLYSGIPRGTIDGLDLRWSNQDDFDIDVAFSDFSVHTDEAIPGVDPLSARLRGDAQGLLLEIPEQQTRVVYSKAFRQPFELSRFGGDIAAWKNDDGWNIQTHQFDIESSGYAISLRGGVQIPGDGSRPSLDLAAVVTRGNVDIAKLFWPTNTMPPSAVSWLDRSLEAGDIVAGRAIIRGDLDSWPFDDRAGRFEARAELRGLRLAYLPDWPRGENLDVTASFINNGMTATARSGTSLGIAVDAVEATIADFHEPVLELSADGHGSGKDLLGYLRATPVGEEHVETLAGLTIGGSGVVRLDLGVPLKHHEDSTLDGRIDLSNSDLDESTWDLHFKKASGQVHFSRSSVLADSLQTSFDGFPVSLGVAIGSAVSDPSHSFEAHLDGVLPTSTIFARASDLAPALPSFPGQADWHIALGIGTENGPEKGRKTLSLSSDLQGIAINLPAPLGKPAEAPQPFSLNLAMPPLGKPFSASLGDVLQIRGRLPSTTVPLSANLDLGVSPIARELPSAGLHIGGSARTLDVGGWIGLFSAGGTGDELLQSINIDVADVRLAGRSFPDLHLDLTPVDDTVKIDVVGESMEGELIVPRVDLRRRGITAQMKHLRWPDPPPGAEDSPSAISDVSPASIPPLHLWIGELKLGSTDFGNMRLESFPTGEGMHIDVLETISPNLDMRANGDWTGFAGESRSHMAIDMTAESLGRMLDTFGFAGIIEGGQTVAHIDASWPGSPAAFVLANTTGSLNVSVAKGRILEVEPGAGGRLFGLLSLREIPRRLSLDFSDLFKSGMSFNSIKGSFALGDGNAQTQDLRIASPAADILISGRTGLRNKDYDQEMMVTPRAGVALPVVGALAGGPVGAAAGLVVQTLIGKSINRAARSRYKVTGSWEKPQIALIGREKVPLGDVDEETDAADQTLPTADDVDASGLSGRNLPKVRPRDLEFSDPVQDVIDYLPVFQLEPNGVPERMQLPMPMPAGDTQASGRGM